MSRPRLNGRYQRDLVAWAKDQGWQCSYTGSGHLRFDHAQVVHPVFTPSTPRVHDGAKERAKLRTALRRATEGRA